MKLIYKAWDGDRHRFLTENEVLIGPSGKIWYNNATVEFPIWEPLPDGAEWLTIKSVILQNDDHSNPKKRLR